MAGAGKVLLSQGVLGKSSDQAHNIVGHDHSEQRKNAKLLRFF
jgi:hypothetical protein